MEGEALKALGNICIGHSESRAANLPRSVEEMKMQDRRMCGV